MKPDVQGVLEYLEALLLKFLQIFRTNSEATDSLNVNPPLVEQQR